jgi:Flp pilus assembly protein TadD
VPSRLTLLRALLIGLLLSGTLLGGAFAGPSDEALRQNERGLALTDEGRHLEAVEAFRKALKASPEDDVIRRNLALARSNLAVALLADGNLKHATHHAEEALRLAPEDPIVILNVAACRDEQGFPAKAAELVRRAQKIGPGVAHVRARMGAVLYREGDLSGAIDEWRVAVELAPTDKALAGRLARAEKAAAVEKSLTPQLSSHFEVLHDAESAVLASLVLRELEDAYRVVGADIQASPVGPVKVVLLSSEQFRATTGTNTWVAGLYDGRIRLPVKGVSDQAALLARARHEYVHAALAPLGKRAPSWLHEGIAQVHEGRPAAGAAARVRKSDSIAFEDLTKSFAATRQEGRARLQYDTALAFVMWLRTGERASQFALAMRRLFEEWTLDDAFEDAYGAPLPEVYLRFQRALRS